MQHYVTIYQTREDEPRRDETLVFGQRLMKFKEAADQKSAVTLLLIELAADEWSFPDKGIAHALAFPTDCSGVQRFELDLDTLEVTEVSL